MMNQPGGILGGGNAPAGGGAAASAAGLPELLAPADVARVLGVSEDDVMATLEKGDLKGKKIGATWRVTRTALDDFLKS
jgi:excisionase family DNA binding protein